MSILGKSKVLASTNGVKVYSKETLSDEIRRLIAANVQLMTDKIETEKARVNLEVNRVQLLGEKNSLVVKKEKLRTEIVTLNITGLFNILICSYQDPLLRLIRDKFKAKRLLSFDNLKKNLSRALMTTDAGIRLQRGRKWVTV